MLKLFGTVVLLGVSGCASNSHEGNIACVQSRGCVSSFPASSYGPVHAQAVAPNSAPPLQPQN